MIHVIATLKIDPARREEFLAAFADLAPKVHAEDGCLEYGVAIDEPTSIGRQELIGDDAVVVVEKWESVAALDAHLDAPHMGDWRKSVGAILRDVSLLVLKPAS